MDLTRFTNRDQLHRCLPSSVRLIWLNLFISLSETWVKSRNNSVLVKSRYSNHIDQQL